MSQNPTGEQRVVFALTEDKQTLILGLTPKAWEYCKDYRKDGVCHTLDLTAFGFPIKVVLFGGKTHDEIRKTLNIDDSVLDLGSLNLGIPNPREE